MEHASDTVVDSAKPSRFINAVTRISSVMAAVGAIIFGGMMIVTVIDVAGRKLFLHPLQGAVELIGLTLIIGGTWVFPTTCLPRCCLPGRRLATNTSLM